MAIKAKPLNIATLQEGAELPQGAQELIVKGYNDKPATTTKETKMATKTIERQELDAEADFGKLLEERERLNAIIAARSSKEFENDVSYINTRAKNFQRPPLDYIVAWLKLMTEEQAKAVHEHFAPAFTTVTGAATAPAKQRKPRAPNGTPKAEKEYKDKDSTGARPQPGVKYRLGNLTWTKVASGLGKAKQEFVDAVHQGRTWAELEDK
jgi:hypothetical protein